MSQKESVNTRTFEDFLKNTCKLCLIKNFRCIKDEYYIGFCVEKDKEVLYDIYLKLCQEK